MIRVLTTKDNEMISISNPKDFEILILRYMGIDCADYYHNQIEALTSRIRNLSDYVNNEDIPSDIAEVLRIHGY